MFPSCALRSARARTVFSFILTSAAKWPLGETPSVKTRQLTSRLSWEHCSGHTGHRSGFSSADRWVPVYRRRHSISRGFCRYCCSETGTSLRSTPAVRHVPESVKRLRVSICVFICVSSFPLILHNNTCAVSFLSHNPLLLLYQQLLDVTGFTCFLFSSVVCSTLTATEHEPILRNLLRNHGL